MVSKPCSRCKMTFFTFTEGTITSMADITSSSVVSGSSPLMKSLSSGQNLSTWNTTRLDFIMREWILLSVWEKSSALKNSMLPVPLPGRLTHVALTAKWESCTCTPSGVASLGLISAELSTAFAALSDILNVAKTRVLPFFSMNRCLTTSPKDLK